MQECFSITVIMTAGRYSNGVILHSLKGDEMTAVGIAPRCDTVINVRMNKSIVQ